MFIGDPASAIQTSLQLTNICFYFFASQEFGHLRSGHNSVVNRPYRLAL